MRSITRLLSVTFDDERALHGVVEARVSPDSIFVDEAQGLDPAALCELLAQAFAATSGYAAALCGEHPRSGFLVAVRALRILEAPALGATLRLEVRATAVFGAFVVLAGEAYCDGRLIASGELNIWIPESSPQNPPPNSVTV